MSRFASGLQAFVDELKRRHVFRVATAYAVGAFVVLEAATLVFQGLLVPDWVYRALTVAALVGFPVVLVLAWLFEWTSHGIRREAPLVEPSEAIQPIAVRVGAHRQQTSHRVRAFAFTGLGIVIALVGMGLSLPYMYAQREAQGGTEQAARRDGVIPASNDSRTATLAVLPFVSLTGGNDDGFGDGLAEDVTAALAQLGGVAVVSRTTSEAYRNSDKTARVIGAELGVGLILEGTVRRSGDRVRVTAQLIDAATDRHLWANTYDRELTGDVFRTQSQLAQEIVAAIQSVVTPEQQEQAERRLLAHGLSDEGNDLLRRANPAYDEAAEQLFDQALAADPNVAGAHAGLAHTLASRAPTGPHALVDSAAAHAERAILLDPERPEGYAARAFVMLVKGEVDSARIDLRRAVELGEPSESGTGFAYDWQQRVRMVSPEALETAQRVLSEIRVTPMAGSTGHPEAPAPPADPSAGLSHP